MAEIKKVVEGLEYCAASCKGAWDDENGCPYMADWMRILRIEHGRNGRCVDLLAADALKLLKAQEPRVIRPEEYAEWDADAWAEDFETGIVTAIDKSAVPAYGRYIRFDRDGMKRLWTGRPTAEQREAEPWR